MINKHGVDITCTIFSPSEIERIEKAKDCVYVCETTRDKNSDVPVAVFYRNTHDPQYTSRYFCVFISNLSFLPTVYVAGFNTAEQIRLAAIKDSDGVYHYSHWRHDFKAVGPNDTFIDGGREYTRTNAEKVYNLKIVDGELMLDKTINEVSVEDRTIVFKHVLKVLLDASEKHVSPRKMVAQITGDASDEMYKAAAALNVHKVHDLIQGEMHINEVTDKLAIEKAKSVIDQFADYAEFDVCCDECGHNIDDYNIADAVKRAAADDL